MARDPNWPARNNRCNACGGIGHFAICCKTKGRKPLTRDDQGTINSRVRTYQQSEDSATGEKDYYALTIDSGASCNVIDQATWKVLNKKRIQGESNKSRKKLFAYGQKDPIEVIGTFLSEIVCEISGDSCVGEFTVVKGPGRPLLGRNTAEVGRVKSRSRCVFIYY